jgi:hypothetical protein
MTIAACYLSPEGVVLGADSTTTMFFDQPGTTGFRTILNTLRSSLKSRRSPKLSRWQL